MDQFISGYRVSIRRKKFYMSLFDWLISVTIYNSWILYKKVIKMNLIFFNSQHKLLQSVWHTQIDSKEVDPQAYQQTKCIWLLQFLIERHWNVLGVTRTPDTNVWHVIVLCILINAFIIVINTIDKQSLVALMYVQISLNFFIEMLFKIFLIKCICWILYNFYGKIWD